MLLMYVKMPWNVCFLFEKSKYTNQLFIAVVYAFLTILHTSSHATAVTRIKPSTLHNVTWLFYEDHCGAQI